MKKILLLISLLIVLTSLSAKNTKVKIETNKGDIELELFDKKAPKTVANFVGLAEGTKEFTDPKTQKKVKRPFYDGLIFHRVIADFMIQGGCPLGTGTGGPGYRFEDETYTNSKTKLSGKIKNDSEAKIVFEQAVVPYLKELKGDVTKMNPEIKEVLDKCNAAQSYAPFKEKTVEFYTERTKAGDVYMQELVAPVDYGTICMANSGPNTNGSQFFIVTKKQGCNWLNGKHTVFGKVTKGMNVVHKIEKVEKKPGDKPVEDVVIKSIRVIK